jgi:hypothetical protein
MPPHKYFEIKMEKLNIKTTYENANSSATEYTEERPGYPKS